MNNWQDLLEITDNNSEKAKNDGKYHYSFSLDNLSQTKGFGFYQLAGNEFYYGENLDIRITTSVTKDKDPRDRLNCDEEYVVNSLYETIFDPAVVTGGLEDKSADLSSAEIQRSITNLNFNDGNDLPNEILKGDNTVNFTPRHSKENHYAAVIDNCRHLENLNDLISKVDTQNQNGARFVLTNAVQGCDIIWKQLWEGDSSQYNNEYEPYVTELSKNNNGITAIYYEGAKRSKDGYYLPIHLQNSTYLKSYDGGGHKIAGITVSKLAGEDKQSQQYGLFGLIDQNSNDFTIQNLTLEDPQIEDATVAGYFVGAANRMLNLNNDHITYKYLEKHSLTAAQDCGGLVGNAGAGAKVKECSINASDLSISNTVSYAAVGGFIGGATGQITVSQSNILCTKSFSVNNGQYTGGLVGGGENAYCGLINCSIEAPEIKVSSNGNDGYAGGIIGKFKPLLIIKEDESKATISACHLSGKNSSSLCRLTVTSPNYCGGLAAVVDGSDDLTVENSYIDADESEVSVTGTNSNYGGGGLFGKCLVTGKVTMENCHFRGRTAVVRRSLISNNAPKGHFGGLIGDVNGTSQFIMDGCYASTYIYAPYSDSTGGLIGYLNTASTSGTVSKITNCYVSGRTNNGTYNAKYEMPEDTTNLTEQTTMMNIVGQNCSGGFIGQLDWGNLEIDRSFSTASVYCYASSYNETSGGVGGFLGCRNQNTSVLNITGCYSTGLVQQQYSEQPAAGFIGKLSGSDNMTLEDCHTLKGINPGMKPLYQTKNSGVTKVEAADLSHVSDQVVNTHTYDELLKGNYPYIFTKTDSIESSDGIDYDGDWPTVFGEDVDKRVSATGITFNLNNPKVVVGGSTEITAMINPPDADASTVTWKTDSANIEISGTGNTVTIQGKSAGDASVTASIEEDNITATCNIQVVEPHIDINNTSMSIVTETSAQLTATTYIMGDDKTVTWTSSDNEIALVDNNGTVTGGSKVGRATVTAISNADNNLKASCSVYVCPNSTVFIMSDDQVVQENASLDVGKSQQAPYTCIFKHNNDNAWLAISVDDNNIANAWLNGNTLVINGVNTGSTKITITGNYYDSSLGGNAAVSRTITVLVSLPDNE